jgi:hypothetical protein
MDDTTDTLARPVVGFPPPTVDSAATSLPNAPWPGQISQAGPSLPNVAPPIQRQPSFVTDPLEHLDFEVSEPRSAKKQVKSGGSRRGISWLIIVALLGGMAYAGVTYGPDLIERVTEADENSGPDAPRVYPRPAAAPIVVRTATFDVSEPDAFGGTQNYEVTADFDSGVARIIVPRTETPDLEMLTLWDQAFIRRVDEATWYNLPRGDLPLDFSLGAARWIRTLDDLVSPTIRSFTTIDEANESSVGTTPARRLVVSTDSNRLLQAQTASATPAIDGSPPPPPPMPAGVPVQPALDSAERITMEIWVDGTGLVRQSVLPLELGGETITVTSVSADPWEPEFPAPDVIEPLTAEALLHLGI